jgi:hypothetical protein
MGSRAMTY